MRRFTDNMFCDPTFPQKSTENAAQFDRRITAIQSDIVNLQEIVFEPSPAAVLPIFPNGTTELRKL